MLIRDWMAKDVLTIDENTSVMRATRIMKEKNVRRLPVLSHGKLTGMITDRDLKDASPSKSTSLDIHEMYYLLSEMKVNEMMTPNPICMIDTDSLEKAAVVMLMNKISGLPIVGESGQLVGLLSETDILQAFIDSTGIQDGTVIYVFDLADAPGSVTKLVDTMRQFPLRVRSILSSFELAKEGTKRVSIRVSVDEDKIDELTKTLSDAYGYDMVFFAKDELSNLPRK
jgi:acetoin utilization protein AcuB